MTAGYFFFYTEANIVCITIFAVLLFHDWKYNTRQEKQIWFDRTVIAHILYFLSDIGWAAVLSGYIARTRLTVALFNFLDYSLLSLITYGWFMYMAASENMLIGTTRKQRTLFRLPVLISILGIVIAYFIAPKFWISEEGELNPLYYPLMVAVPIIYLLASFICSIINAKKADSPEEKRLFVLIGCYPLSVMVFGLIQLFALNAPLFCFGCTIMMLFFYIQAMQNQISVDPLTRLNNRGQLDRYIGQIRYRENVPSFAVMIDIDRFKQINDTYGHAEGDRALVLVAEAMKQTAEQSKGSEFLARYGGDEFTMILQPPGGEEAVETLLALLRENIRKKREDNRLPYELQISFGYDVLQGGGDKMEDCLMRADEKLYLEKKKTGTGR